MDAAVVTAFAINLIAVVSGLWKGISVLITVRDEIRDMRRNIGTKDPADGLLGDVVELKAAIRDHDKSIVALQIQTGVIRNRRSSPLV